MKPKPISTKISFPQANPWTGNEHRLQVAAAQEVGLHRDETAIEFYQKGFASGLVIEDPADESIVLSGRTVLTTAQLRQELAPYLHLHRISPRAIRMLVVDGKFELRIAPQAIYTSSPMRWAALKALTLWTFVGMLGWMLSTSLVAPLLPLILYLFGGLVGLIILSQGLRHVRPLLAKQLLASLSRCAHHRQLILPPVNRDLL